MDFSKFKPSDWMIVAGGLVMLICGLVLPWRSLDVEGFSDSGDNAFDFFFTGGLAWILVVGAGVIALLLALGSLKADTAPWMLIILGATGLGTLLMLLRVILGAGDVPATGGEFEFDRGIGMYFSLVAAAVAAGGAVWKFTESGGNLKDLTDMNKLKSEFGRGDTGAAPPPPPAG